MHLLIPNIHLIFALFPPFLLVHAAPNVCPHRTMDHVNTVDDDLKVTERKAARSLRLFRGDQVDFLDENNTHHNVSSDHQEPPEPVLDPLLEPVSSATYFPHTPLKEKPVLDDVVSVTSVEPLQHLTADVEFDHTLHGDITKLHKSDAPLEKRQAYPLTVELRPFHNKVGGHTAIFRFSKRAVCKALMNRENVWYEAVERRHLKLLQFMPKYIGVLNVRYSSLVTENERAEADLPASNTNESFTETNEFSLADTNTETPSLANQRRVARRPSLPSGSKMSPEDPPPEVLLDDNRHIIPDLLWKHYSNSAPNSSAFDELAISPVASIARSAHSPDRASIGATSLNTDLQAQVIQEVFIPSDNRSREIFPMDEEGHVLRKHTRFERFILLEDLTVNLHKPCALDLKMGTRQYGVEANEAKQALQRKKCSLTTSRELGVRVCGLQVWNKTTGRYFLRDKYYGRGLKAGQQFAKTLSKFLYDGESSYSVVSKIPLVVTQLSELFDVFEKLAGYRMYGSSVLLMYDGAAKGNVEVKANIIDFAQSVIGEDTLSSGYKKPPRHPDLPDMGYLRGLQSLIRYFKAIFEIVSGDAYDSVPNMELYLDDNRERLSTPCHWIGNYSEDDEEHAAVSGPDPFDLRYLTFPDEIGISD